MTELARWRGRPLTSLSDEELQKAAIHAAQMEKRNKESLSRLYHGDTKAYEERSEHYHNAVIAITQEIERRQS